MKNYDLIVIGSGCGLLVVEAAAEKGWKTALVEKGQIGGTCLNVGCIPSKMLIYPADVIYEIERSGRLGIKASVDSLNFKSIVERTVFTISGYRNKLHRQLNRMNGVDLYEKRAKFKSDNVIDVDGESITSPRIIISVGTRPVLPDEKLLNQDGILTNDNLLDLKEIPRELIIVGGGYVACEYAHFFTSMGSKVVIIEMADRLLTSEEPEISELVWKTLSENIDIHLNTKFDEIEKTGSGWKLTTVSDEKGKKQEYLASHVLFAMGRRSNADLLELEKTSIKTDSKGFISADQYLSTNIEGIYAIGDINGVQMFRHAANYEAEIAWHNIAHSNQKNTRRVAVSYQAMPRAVFTRPQVAAVGMTEAEAKKTYPTTSQTTYFYETAKGEAMQEKEGFVKVVANRESGQILGCHIAGPQASVLIQEVVNSMAADGTASSIHHGIHIHPALSEVIAAAFSGF